MPITSDDLVLYTSANHPTDDIGTSGGAIDATRRAEFAHFGSPARVALISDGADTRVATIAYRDAAGSYLTENVTLNGASEVLSIATAERLLMVTLDGTSPNRTVTVKEGSGGTTRGSIGLNETGIAACFIGSASESGTVNRHEKLFWKNRHTSLTLNAATITLTADPAARIKIGLAATKGDTASITNRKATPGGITFVDDNVSVAVPTNSLAAGEAIGMWVQQGLLANDAPIKSSFTARCSGTSS